MGIFESLRSFEASLPKICLYCRGGWLSFPPVYEGMPAVFCSNAHYTTRPRSKKGVKLPKTDYFPLVAPSFHCDYFTPIKINDTKAILLDIMGFFNETKLRPLPDHEGKKEPI